MLITITSHAAELRDEWIDADTGHRVVRLSRMPGESQSFYFHQNAFTANGDKMVFTHTVTNRVRQLCVLDWKTRAISPLTDSFTNRGEIVHAKTRQAFWVRRGKVFVTDIDTHSTRELAEIPFGWQVATVNADATLLAGTFVDGGQAIDTSGPKSDWFDTVFDAKRPQQLFTIEIATGKTNLVHRYEGWLGHLQFSPTDPTLLQFCHEGPWHKLDRIWHIRTDGSGLRLMHARTMPMEIAGHEFWSPDGKTVWFDLQMPKGEKFFLAGVAVNGGQTTRYPIARNEWSVHYNISADGKLFAGDGGATNMVAKAPDGKWIYLFTPQPDGKLKAEKLVNMAKHDYDLEPNVQFTPDGKWIVFRANFEGLSQVYAVEVAKASREARR